MNKITNPCSTNSKLNQYKKVSGDLRRIAHEMAQEVLIALADEIDDINVTSYKFRTAIESTALRVMRHIDKSNERVGIYEEALPGFTLMVIKKHDGHITTCQEQNVTETELDIAVETFEAASLVIQNFMTRAKQTIISIDHEFVLLILFPVTDTRKHLKTLGMYDI